MRVSLLKERHTWYVNLRNQYLDLSKLLDNGILNSMISLPLLDLKIMFLIDVYT